MDSPGIPVQENRMSRKACRKKCDGQNARLPLPNDLKLGGLNGLVSVLTLDIVFPCMDEFETVFSQKIVGK